MKRMILSSTGVIVAVFGIIFFNFLFSCLLYSISLLLFLYRCMKIINLDDDFVSKFLSEGSFRLFI